MNRKKRTEILINGSSQLVSSMAQQIVERYQVKTMEEPNQGLVMVKIRESAQHSLFYLGEVLVTECRVQVEEEIGLGIVKGVEPTLAYHLAVIDAAYKSKLSETQAWMYFLEKEADQIADQRKKQEAKIMKTKVNFETMDIDD